MPRRTEKIQERSYDGHFAEIHVGVILVGGIGAEIDALQGPQDVAGGEDDGSAARIGQRLAEVPDDKTTNTSPMKPHRPGRPRPRRR